mmetsp:Transcript_33706/g.99310  ORF Transcript_33706/g.99310 Transcript_33706/m.99310 type:complete len:303 (-) Transcript_33706:103-1011(-)
MAADQEIHSKLMRLDACIRQLHHIFSHRGNIAQPRQGTENSVVGVDIRLKAIVRHGLLSNLHRPPNGPTVAASRNQYVPALLVQLDGLMTTGTMRQGIGKRKGGRQRWTPRLLRFLLKLGDATTLLITKSLHQTPLHSRRDLVIRRRIAHPHPHLDLAIVKRWHVPQHVLRDLLALKFLRPMMSVPTFHIPHRVVRAIILDEVPHDIVEEVDGLARPAHGGVAVQHAVGGVDVQLHAAAGHVEEDGVEPPRGIVQGRLTLLPEEDVATLPQIQAGRFDGLDGMLELVRVGGVVARFAQRQQT